MLDFFYSVWTSLFGGEEGISIDYLFTLGIIIFIVVFALLVVINFLSYHAKLRSQLKGINNYLKDVRAIDAQNVQKLNAQYMNKAVPTLKRGWGCFLAAQYGYPSEYMAEVDTLRSPAAKNHQKSALAWFLFIVTGFSLLFASILGAVAIDREIEITFIIFSTALLAFFGVLFYLILKIIYNRSNTATYKHFKEFQELIDVKVELQSDMRLVGNVKNYNFGGLSNAAVRSGEDIGQEKVTAPTAAKKEAEPPVKKNINQPEPQEEIIVHTIVQPPKPAVFPQPYMNPEPVMPATMPKPAQVFEQPKNISRVDVICAKVDAIVNSGEVELETLQRINVIAQRAKDNDITLSSEDSNKLSEALRKITNAIKAKQK